MHQSKSAVPATQLYRLGLFDQAPMSTIALVYILLFSKELSWQTRVDLSFGQ